MIHETKMHQDCHFIRPDAAVAVYACGNHTALHAIALLRGARVFFVWDYVVSLRIENALLCYLVIILQLLLKYWPLLLGIMRTQTLNEWGFSRHLRIIRIAAIGCFLFIKLLDFMIVPEYELQRIAYFKEHYPNAFS